MSAEGIDTTSSIGACWPPAISTSERIRGFFTDRVIETPDDVEQFAEAYHEADARLEDSGATRLSLRAVASTSMLEGLERAGIRVEAAMPFCLPTPGRTRGDDVVVYAGRNLAERQGAVDPDTARVLSASDHQQLWRSTLHDRRRAIGRRLDSRLRVCETSGADTDNDVADVLDQFIDLYRPFGYGPSEVLRLLTNPSNRIVFIQAEDGTILSSAMAEIASVVVGGVGEVVMAEVTEASTHPEFRGQGLYRLASGILLCRLADVSREQILAGEPPINVIYGECNLNMPGVLHAATQNGRRFAAADAPVLGAIFSTTQRAAQGRPPFGVLEQNFRVEDGIVAPGRYNDFGLSYLPASVMASLLAYPGGPSERLVIPRTAA